MPSDLISAMTLLRSKSQPIARVAESAPPRELAPDMASLFGFAKCGTAAPLEDRTSEQQLIFEKPLIRAAILDRLKKGFPCKTVLQAAGITPAQHRSWRQKAQRMLEPYSTFIRELDIAEAEGVIVHLDNISRAGEGAPDQHGVWHNKWEASRYLVERIDPETYTEVSRSITAHIDVPPPAQLDVRKMSTEDLEKMLEIAERAPVVIDAEVVDED